MDESEKLDDILGCKLFNDKYRVKWCELCGGGILCCPIKDCGATTCNAQWCNKPECMEVYNDFKLYKSDVEDYLTEDEQKIWHKGLKIKELILETIPEGYNKIPFEELKTNGEFSINDEEMFKKELNKVD